MRCKIFWHQNSLKGVARSSVRRILAAAAAAGHTFAVPGTHAAATECTAAAPPRCLFIRGKTVRRFLRVLSVCRQRTDRAARSITALSWENYIDVTIQVGRSTLVRSAYERKSSSTARCNREIERNGVAADLACSSSSRSLRARAVLRVSSPSCTLVSVLIGCALLAPSFPPSASPQISHFMPVPHFNSGSGSGAILKRLLWNDRPLQRAWASRWLSS